MNKWKDAFLQLPKTGKYKYFLKGASLQRDRDTWDVDISIVGEIDSYENLEEIMYIATQLGFENRQLIDISWCDYSYERHKKGACNYRELACDDYYNTGKCSMQECLNSLAQKKRIKYGKKITTQGKTVQNDVNIKTEETTVSYKGELIVISSPHGEESNLKHKGKMSKSYYKYPIVEITKNTDFRNHILWP